MAAQDTSGISNVSLGKGAKIPFQKEEFGEWCWRTVSLLSGQVQKEVKAFGGDLVAASIQKKLTDDIMFASVLYGVQKSILELETIIKQKGIDTATQEKILR
jgi:hypothetical protein